MTEEALYRIEEFATIGWQTVTDMERLNRARAKEEYEGLINEGYNPNRLRIIREV